MGHMIKPKDTKVFFDEFKGNKTFAIWPIDHEGNKASEYPLMAFGKAKAKEIIKHLEELKEFINE